MRDLDKFRGCLIGGAAGDALGYAVEFMREDRIFARYGAGGITEYALEGGKALISDDTQMTLFTATALLYGTTRGRMRGIMGPWHGYLRYAYKDWLQTQEERYPLAGYHHSWLVNLPEMFSRRAPGNTCLSALHSDQWGTVEDPINDSKGCGGVMRVAPVGLYFNGREYYTVQDVAKIGADAAAVTHGHPMGWMPAAALAQIIHEVAQDGAEIADAVRHSLATAEELWPDVRKREKLTALTEKALELAGGETDDLEAIHQLGEGWVAEETLAIAVYCAVKYQDDFDRALIAAVNHNGDSDSTGAVTGNILGAKLGLSGIPEKWLKDLELKDLILEIADDLYNDCRMSEYDYEHEDPVWTRKYIEVCYPGWPE